MNEQMIEMLRAQEAAGSATKAKLVQKLVNVIKAVDSVPKSGYNSHQRYHYATEADVMNVVREQLIKNNLFIFTSSNLKQVDTRTDKEGKVSFITTVVTEHVICDADTGATHTVFSSGQGHDSLDKGIFKAITGANKYFLQKTFMISGEDDPESDGVSAPVPPTRTSFSNKTSGTVVDNKGTLPPSNSSLTVSVVNTPNAPTPVATVTPIKQQTTAPVVATKTASAPVRRSFSRAPVQTTTAATPIQQTTTVTNQTSNVIETDDSEVRF